MKYLLETERLGLRKIELQDKEDMLKLHSSPIVQKYTGEPVIESIDEMTEAIQQRLDNYDVYGYGRWGTFLKEGNQFVGWAGLAYLPEFDIIDIGYRFLPEYWGMGIATEASHAILQYAFDTLKIEKIYAIAMKENIASMRVMEKVGMEFLKYAAYEEGAEDAAWYWCDKDLYSRIPE